MAPFGLQVYAVYGKLNSIQDLANIWFLYRKSIHDVAAGRLEAGC